MQEQREQEQAELFPDNPALIVKEAAQDPEATREPPADWQGYDPEILSTVLDD